MRKICFGTRSADGTESHSVLPSLLQTARRQGKDAIGFGNYNGLQASLNRRFHDGLSLRAAYTYSRALDNAPQELESNSGDAHDATLHAG